VSVPLPLVFATVEWVNVITHFGGAAVFAVLAIPLVRRGRGSAARVFLLSVFAFSAVLLLSISGAYHLLAEGGNGRAVMRRIDHAAIFVLIAGTFTAAHGILFRGIWRWGILLLVWSAAITGITLKSVFFNDVSYGLGVAFYLALGWVGMIGGTEIWRRWGFRFVAPMLWGGLAYTAGAVIDLAEWPTLIPGVVGFHELFHVAVLMGVAFHWKFVHSFADGRLPGQEFPGSTVAP